jgi:nitroreductase
MAAPSAMTKDPWRFIIVREPSRLQQLADALAGGKMLATAALAVVVCGDLNASFDRQLSFLLQDCSAATQNLLLAAHGLGLGGCWVGVHPDEVAVRRLKQELTLPAPFIPMAVVALGHPGEELPPRTRFSSDRVRFEKW